MLFCPPNIRVGLRDSLLSKAQMKEVLEELRFFYLSLHFEPLFIKTRGDVDRMTSLRSLEKSDFFTREIDERQLRGDFRIAIHSAKDLAEPLREGLEIGALTKGVESYDVLVMREGDNFSSLKKNARIGTSSFRREEMIRTLREDISFVDIRGCIEERLALLFSGGIDGVVMAEAALIRLKLTHLNRLRLCGEVAPLQGRLAVIVREEDEEMKRVLQAIDYRTVERTSDSMILPWSEDREKQALQKRHN